VMSLIVPGLGQIYNGQFLKGVMMFVVAVALIATFVGIFVLPVVWIVAVIDAYHVAGSRVTVEKSVIAAMGRDA